LVHNLLLLLICVAALLHREGDGWAWSHPMESRPYLRHPDATAVARTSGDGTAAADGDGGAAAAPAEGGAEGAEGAPAAGGEEGGEGATEGAAEGEGAEGGEGNVEQNPPTEQVGVL
jgi:hypothetical protein